MRICRTCGLGKLVDEFLKNPRYKDGYDTRCKSCERARTNAYYEAGGKDVAKKYREAKAAENIEYQRKYREENKQALLEKRRQNVEHKKMLDQAYAAKYPDKVVAKAAKRRANKKSATPAWASKAYIDLFYQMAKDEEKRTGREVHVDHIVPLKSKLVCGLHCEDNLQLLFKTANLQKSNVTWPDMWEPL